MGENEHPRVPSDQVLAWYEPGAEGYDARHADGQDRFEVIEAPLRELCTPDAHVLEVGCGTGRFLAGVSAARRVGVDLSPAMLAQARARGLEVVTADLHQLPFDNGSFDVVVAPRGVFRYVDYAAAFRECARVLRRGGRLGVHQYAARTWSPLRPLRSLHADSELHVRGARDLVAPARAAGLKMERVLRFRGVRFRPHVVRLPRWLVGPWWSHVVVVARKP